MVNTIDRYFTFFKKCVLLDLTASFTISLNKKNELLRIQDNIMNPYECIL